MDYWIIFAILFVIAFAGVALPPQESDTGVILMLPFWIWVIVGFFDLEKYIPYVIGLGIAIGVIYIIILILNAAGSSPVTTTDCDYGTARVYSPSEATLRAREEAERKFGNTAKKKQKSPTVNRQKISNEKHVGACRRPVLDATVPLFLDTSIWMNTDSEMELLFKYIIEKKRQVYLINDVYHELRIHKEGSDGGKAYAAREGSRRIRNLASIGLLQEIEEISRPEKDKRYYADASFEDYAKTGLEAIFVTSDDQLMHTLISKIRESDGKNSDVVDGLAFVEFHIKKAFPNLQKGE